MTRIYNENDPVLSCVVKSLLSNCHEEYVTRISMTNNLVECLLTSKDGSIEIEIDCHIDTWRKVISRELDVILSNM